MSDPTATRAVVVLHEAPTAATLMKLHRLLCLGLADIRHRVASGSSLVDVELFTNEQGETGRMLRSLLEAVGGLEHSVHECLGDEPPSPENKVTAEILRNVLDAHEDGSLPGPAPVSEPVPELVDGIAEAARRAIDELRTQHPEDFCVYALVTVGEALRPYLAVTVHGEGRWDLADSPYAVVGDAWFARTAPLFEARGELDEMDASAADNEYAVRLASMEEALRRLDGEGLFGVDDERGRALLLVATMPPDETDAGYARRLNPPGPLLDAWLVEAAEGGETS